MSNRDEVNNAMTRMMVPLVQERDQKLVKLREHYASLTDNEKSKLRCLVSAEQKVLLEKGNDYNPIFPVAPHTLLRAIDAWNKGTDFTPDNSL